MGQGFSRINLEGRFVSANRVDELPFLLEIIAKRDLDRYLQFLRIAQNFLIGVENYLRRERERVDIKCSGLAVQIDGTPLVFAFCNYVDFQRHSEQIAVLFYAAGDAKAVRSFEDYIIRL